MNQDRILHHCYPSITGRILHHHHLCVLSREQEERVKKRIAAFYFPVSLRREAFIALVADIPRALEKQQILDVYRFYSAIDQVIRLRDQYPVKGHASELVKELGEAERLLPILARAIERGNPLS